MVILYGLFIIYKFIKQFHEAINYTFHHCGASATLLFAPSKLSISSICPTTIQKAQDVLSRTAITSN